MSAKARLQCLQDWRRSMKIVTKEEKAFKSRKSRKPRRNKFQKS